MSLVFRAVFAHRGVFSTALKSNYVKFNVQLPVANGNYCRCKVLTSLQRKYSTESNDKAKSNDASEEIQRIYTGLLAKNIRNVKLFSLSTSFFGLACQPIVYMKAVTAGATMTATLPMFTLVGLFALSTPPLLHMITKRYVLSVDYDPKDDKYIATVYNLFVMKRQIEFVPEEINIPTVLGMLTTCSIRGKPIFLDQNSFTDLEHYGRIMGYDKPLDLKVDIEDQTCSKKDTH